MTQTLGPAPLLRRSVLAHLGAAIPLLLAVAWGLGQAMGVPYAYPAAVLVAFLPVLWFALTRLGAHAGPGWGHANRVTLLRSGLLALVGGTLPFAHALGTGPAWVVAVIAVTALVLDGVDGWLARRQGLSSPYGARFDMEMDTLAILYLCLLLFLSGEVGAWVLLSALLRPLFVAAGWVWPVVARPLPHSQRRRVICMVQVGVLALAVTPLAGPPLTGLAVGAALALLLFSFSADTVWLLSRRDDAGGTKNG
ncbi:CDP-alcohol phosphatidyltransferase family protein [Niveispirillum sp. KHB5.9]|uniref:CDP-alcohol phosphatidyltransferase family protein n=1 Tax=Niveispirillum sp. KHB5.9 TaxID=3400269 RepID=UPI003A8C4F0D